MSVRVPRKGSVLEESRFKSRILRRKKNNKAILGESETIVTMDGALRGIARSAVDYLILGSSVV